MKKNKGPFCSLSYPIPSIPSHPIKLGLRPRFVDAGLDPGGRGKELVGKGLDTVHQKIEIAFKFKWKIPYKFIGPRTKFIKEFPLYFIWVQFTGKSFVFFFKKSTFRLIFKKSYQEGVFDFIYPDPQLVQIFKPTRNLSGHFLYIYMSIYEYNVKIS